MRSNTYRIAAIVSLLSIFFGSQLCMLVDCAPRTRAAHPCCAAAAAQKTEHGRPAPAHDCGRPCCIGVTLPHAPELDRPLTQDAHALVATLAAALSGLERLPVALAPSPPGGDGTPPASPPRSAAGTRAPPVA